MTPKTLDPLEAALLERLHAIRPSCLAPCTRPERDAMTRLERCGLVRRIPAAASARPNSPDDDPYTITDVGHAYHVSGCDMADEVERDERRGLYGSAPYAPPPAAYIDEALPARVLAWKLIRSMASAWRATKWLAREVGPAILAVLVVLAIYQLGVRAGFRHGYVTGAMWGLTNADKEPT